MSTKTAEKRPNRGQYEIAKPNYRCAACDEEVACEAPYYSAIFLHADQLVRRDFCPDCWEAAARRRETGATSDTSDTSSATEESRDEADAPVAEATGSTEGHESEAPGDASEAPSDASDAPSDEDVPLDAQPYAFWRTRRPPLPTDQPKRVRFDVELALQFFRSVVGSPTDADAGEASVEEAGVEDGVVADPQTETEGTLEAGGETSEAAQEAAGAAEETTVAAEEDAGVDSPAGTSRGELDQLGFVVALLLIRKKVLTLDSTANRDGDEYLKVTERKEPKTSSWIRNPQLGSGELERVKTRLGDLLHMQV